MLYQPFKNNHWDDGFSSGSAIRDAERSLNILARLYFIRHSFEATDIYLLSALSKLGFACLQDVWQHRASYEQEDIRSTLAVVLLGLYSQGQHVNVTRNVYSLIKKSIPAAELRLIQYAEDFRADQSTVKEEYIKGEVQAGWSPSIINILDNANDKGLSSLVSKSKSTNDNDNDNG